MQQPPLQRPGACCTADGLAARSNGAVAAAAAANIASSIRSFVPAGPRVAEIPALKKPARVRNAHGCSMHIACIHIAYKLYEMMLHQDPSPLSCQSTLAKLSIFLLKYQQLLLMLTALRVVQLPVLEAAQAARKRDEERAAEKAKQR